MLRNLLILGRRPFALLLIGIALLALMLSWWPSAGVRELWSGQRPLALMLLGIGALLMWFETRRPVRPPRGF